MGKPLNAIDTTTFPLTPRLRQRLKVVVEAVYGDNQFIVLCGLEPNLYTNTENVIIHAGLASHIGSRRGLSGHEGGDDTALRKLFSSREVTRLPDCT